MWRKKYFGNRSVIKNKLIIWYFKEDIATIKKQNYIRDELEIE